MVIDFPDRKTVGIWKPVFRSNNGDSDDVIFFTEFPKPGPDDQFVTMQYLRILPGIDLDDPENIGNTVLLELSHNTYFCIKGREPFLFKTEDRIEEYFSPVGPNDVPYPFALGTENVYLMIDQKFTSRKNFPDNRPRWKLEDGYLSRRNPYDVAHKYVRNSVKWKSFHESYQKMCAKEAKKIMAYSKLTKKLQNLENTIKNLKLEIEHLKCLPGPDYIAVKTEFETLCNQK